MKELLNKHKRISLTEAKDLALVDTCFFIDELKHHRDTELLGLGMTSFNVEELIHVSKHLPSDIKEHIRHFLKKHPEFVVVDIDVHPGDHENEQEYVSKVDPQLLKMVPDASDAVLIAAAIIGKCSVLTKDKHHLFKAIVENYLPPGIKVFKEMKDYLKFKKGEYF